MWCGVVFLSLQESWRKKLYAALHSIVLCIFSEAGLKGDLQQQTEHHKAHSSLHLHKMVKAGQAKAKKKYNSY